MASILSPTSIDASVATTDEVTGNFKVYHGDHAAPNPPAELDSHRATNPYLSPPDPATSSPVVRSSLPVPNDAVSSPTENTTLQEHDGSIETALRALLDENIPIVEYGSQVQHRYGYEELLTVAEWAVPEEHLKTASKVLLEHGFSLVEPEETPDLYWADWELAGYVHRLGPGQSRVILYPLREVGLTLLETVEVPSTFSKTLCLHSPKPPRYMLSLICLLWGCPPGSSKRWRIDKDLNSFISAYLFCDPPADTQINFEEDLASEEEFKRSIDRTLQKMKSWNWEASGDDQKYIEIAESIVQNCEFDDRAEEEAFLS